MLNPVSRLEKNFVRLLTRSENYVPQREPNEWRLEQYVKNLEERLAELKKMNTWLKMGERLKDSTACTLETRIDPVSPMLWQPFLACQYFFQPSKDTLAEYSRRVEFLRGVVEAEKLPTITEKALANQLLSHGTFTSASNKIHQQTKAHYLREMREELLGTKDHQNAEGIRLRQINGNSTQDDLDAVMQYHNSMQEKVAQEMMSLVQNLKQNSLLAGHIIRKDTEVLQKSSSMADDRYSRLKVESEKLEVYAKKSCNWCVWIMLAMVCLTFMWMIVFIRLFPKR